MASLQFVATLSGGAFAYLGAISDLAVLAGPGAPVLHSASGALGGTTSFALAPGAVAQFTGQSGYATNTLSFARVDHAGSTLLLSQVRVQQMLAQADAGPNGAATGTPIYHRNSGFAGDQVTMLAIRFGTDTFVYSGKHGTAGLASYSVGGTGTATFTPLAAIPDTPGTALGDVAALASTRIGPVVFLFVASAGENGITAFRVSASGSLAAAATIGIPQGLFVSGITAIETVQVGGETFLLATAAGSSTLSVIRVEPDGRMHPADHVYDSLDTRFANAAVLEIVTVGSRVFVLVAGSDDGLTLFTLLPSGRLLHLGSYADTAGTSLQNVSALAAVVVGSEIQVFASSQAEPGISQFRIDLAALGQTVTGGPANDSFTGGAADDLLAGAYGDDQLAGGFGNDILMDGAGADVMWGGAGADTFVLTYDGAADRIMDFQPGADKLDLSAWPMLYAPGQLGFVSTATGAILTFGTEWLEIITASGTPLALAQLATPDILNIMRQSGLLKGPNLILSGTAGNDLLIGAAGNDRFRASPGADWMSGGSGMDTMIFGAGSGPVTVDLVYSSRNSGMAAFDEFDSIETFSGTAAPDTFAGNALANIFLGGGAHDRLLGRGGRDRLDGQSGADVIVGGGGGDTLTGGAGADRFVFYTIGASAAVAGHSDLITDFLVGTDHVTLSPIDANTTRPGNQAFAFRGAAAFSGQPGEVRVIQDTARDRTLIEADVNGDRLADMRITLSGLHSLTAGDFLL